MRQGARGGAGGAGGVREREKERSCFIRRSKIIIITRRKKFLSPLPSLPFFFPLFHAHHLAANHSTHHEDPLLSAQAISAFSSAPSVSLSRLSGFLGSPVTSSSGVLPSPFSAAASAPAPTSKLTSSARP